MHYSKIISALLSILFWVPVLFFSFLLSHNAILYYTHGGDYGILPEKAIALRDPVWKVSFYIHILAGIICLFAPVVSFLGKRFGLGLKIHRIVGQWYVWTTLLIVCPTGMYLALYAKGGFVTQLGFMVQGILLGWFTYRGYTAILNGDRDKHVHNMIRSYAIATVVLTFRIFHIVFFIYYVPYADNYALSQWLGLVVNAWMAELIILFITYKKNKFNLKTQKL